MTHVLRYDDDLKESPHPTTFVNDEVVVTFNKDSRIRGYKIFGPNYTCNGYKYSLHSPNIYPEDIIPCMSGFHYCQQAIDCLRYYEYTPQNTYAEVECGTEYSVRGDKVVCRELNIIRVLSYSDFGKLITFDIDTPVEKCSYVNGKLDGRYQLYHSTEKLKIETFYTDGNLHGSYKEWYPNGQLWMETQYIHGKRHGLFRMWFPNGKLRIEKSYIDDKCNGIYKEWYECGSVVKEIKFKNDKCDDSYNEWFQSGQLKKEIKFKDGNCKSYKEWNEKGNLLKSEYA